MRQFPEMVQATTDATKSPAPVAPSSIYDILAWDDGTGTLWATRGLPWASDISRGTGAGTAEIDFTTAFPTNKYAVGNGPAANRGVLVGSVRSDALGQLADSAAFRWVSNIYNAVPRNMRVIEPTNNWPYTSQAWRLANGNSANQLDYLQSFGGGLVTADIAATASNPTVPTYVVVGVGIDTVVMPTDKINSLMYCQVSNALVPVTAAYKGYPGLGRHVATWLEYSQANGATTWYGTGGGTLIQSGISGVVFN